VNSERRQRVEEVFQAALELPAGSRAGFVARACGDDDLNLVSSTSRKRILPPLVVAPDGSDSPRCTHSAKLSLAASITALVGSCGEQASDQIPGVEGSSGNSHGPPNGSATRSLSELFRQVVF
jgi:hypothetical protein